MMGYVPRSSSIPPEFDSCEEDEGDVGSESDDEDQDEDKYTGDKIEERNWWQFPTKFLWLTWPPFFVEKLI